MPRQAYLPVIRTWPSLLPIQSTKETIVITDAFDPVQGPGIESH
jgi:hypothetical protein